MTRTQTPVTVATIGDLIDHSYSLDAWCERCRTSRPVDLERLAIRIGRAAPYHGRKLPLVCSDCGGRQVSVTVLSPSRG